MTRDAERRVGIACCHTSNSCDLNDPHTLMPPWPPGGSRSRRRTTPLSTIHSPDPTAMPVLVCGAVACQNMSPRFNSAVHSVGGLR